MPCLLRFFCIVRSRIVIARPSFALQPFVMATICKTSATSILTGQKKISERKRHENNRQTNLYICITDVSHS